MSEHRSPFRIIRGGGEGNRTPRADLVAVEHRPTGSQLVLPGASGVRPVLISLGFKALDFAAFSDLIRTVGVRHIVDIRQHAAFGSRDFRPWLVTELFQECGVDYERMLDLGNPFIGTSGNRELVLQRYREHVHARSDLVQGLIQRLDHGPLLLLGRRREHEDSERAIIIEELIACKARFDMIVVQSDGPLPRMDPTPRKTRTRSGPRKRSPSPPPQPELPLT